MRQYIKSVKEKIVSEISINQNKNIQDLGKGQVKVQGQGKDQGQSEG